IREWDVKASFKVADLEGTVCAHPLRGQGYDFPVPLLPADFVTMDQGTGFVHIAPGHGADDFARGRQHDLPIPQTVDGEGRFLPTARLLAPSQCIKHTSRDCADNITRLSRNRATEMYATCTMRRFSLARSSIRKRAKKGTPIQP